MYGNHRVGFSVTMPREVLGRFAHTPTEGPMRSMQDEYAARLIHELLQSDPGAQILLPRPDTDGSTLEISTDIDGNMLNIMHHVVNADLRDSQ
jgi:hypothetical protein